jgi:hypothetical protein
VPAGREQKDTVPAVVKDGYKKDDEGRESINIDEGWVSVEKPSKAE